MEALAVLEKQQQFDFQNNGIEVMNFETLQRTYKENDIYGKPVQGIYHYQVLQRMMDIYRRNFATENGMDAGWSYPEAEE